MIAHLLRGKPCICMFSDVPREDIIKSLSKSKQSCEYCDKVYMSKKCFDKHVENCLFR